MFLLFLKRDEGRYKVSIVIGDDIRIKVFIVSEKGMTL